MVPIPESSYFPPLDKCLAGEQLLISWKAVYLTISDIDDLSHEKQLILEQYLNQDDVLAVLAQPFTAFTKPSPQTKAAFETKTSAINVTPSSNGLYDIKQIKEDTLWLSKEAGIDEVSALRVVIVECQSRPYAQLLGRFSEEEVVSIQDAAGSSRILSLVPVALLSDSADSKVIQEDFDTQDSRRVRTLQTYLSEREYLLKCVESLLHSALYWPQVGGKGKAPEVATPLLERIGEVLMAKMGEPVGMVLQGISAIERNIKKLEQGSGWYKEEGVRDDIELDWLRNQLVEVLHTMKIVFQLIDCLEEITSSAVVVAWFRLASTYSFFTGVQVPEPYLQQLVHTFQLTACLISLSALSLGDCVDYLSDPGNDMALLPSNDIAYILNPQAIIEVHNALMEAAEATYVTAGPAIFAWCSILAAMRGRKAGQDVEQAQYEDGGSTGDGQLIPRPDVYDEVMEQIMDSIDSDPIHHLAQKAADGCHFLETISEFSVYLGDTPRAVFLPILGARMRIVLMDLISSARANLEYIPEVLTAAISCLTGGQDYWHLTEAKQLQPQNNPIATFLANDQLVGAFLMVAASRYPYESLPFLKLVKAVAACTSSYMQNNTRSIIDFLETIPTFTYVLPEGFANYETTHEEDNNNNIRLTSTVQLFESRMISSKMVLGRGSLNRSLVPAGDFCIPAGTFGRIVSESGPRVAFWFHEYSALKYFGKLLETFLNSRDQIDATTGERVDRDCVAEIIGLLATLVLSSSKTIGVTAHSRDEAQRVLESASAGLSRNSDIISVIFSIFEEELQIQAAAIGSEVPLELLLGCTQFIHAVIPISPGRVWPLIDRSGLLDNGRGLGSGSGRLSSIVRNVELVTSHYKFLISCTRLFDSLVEDLVTHAIARKCTNKSAARFGAREELGTGVPEQVLAKVLLSFTQFLVEVFEDSCTWNFAVDEERTSLSKNISRTLNHIVSYTYGVDGSSDPKSGIMAGLKPAAGYIVDTFLSTNSGTLRFQPLLSGYLDGISTWQTTINLPFRRLREEQVRAIMSFTGSLLQISALEARSASHLEMQLFKASPLIARLYAVNESYRNSVVTVFEALIVSASSNSDEPPSLLGHLGPHTSKNFLRSLTDLDSPLPYDDTVINIWHFFSMVVSCRQQWFANYLLTGKAPRDALKRRCESDELPPSRSLLSNTLETLSSLPQLSKKIALAMLEFVSLAQNYWPWTLYSLEKHASFIDAISEYLGTLPPIQKQPADTLEDRIDACYKTQIVSHVAKILAMHLFHARQRGDSKAVDKLVSNLSYLSRFAVAVPDYNTSLHTNLKRNFESRYPGCQLREFQKTRLDDRNLGRDYFYDLSLADKMLRFDGAWTGRKDDGYSLELATANVNLSLVDTQIAVLESWKVLAIELSSDLKEKVELQKIIAKVARDCIASNIVSSFSEPVFIKLNQTRAEFSLILLQRLVEVKSEVHELYGENGNFRHGILSTAWEAIRSLQGSFGMALAAGDAAYYRCLLRLLFLALRIHAESKFPDPDPRRSTNKLSQQQTTEVIPLVLEILEHVVAKGLRDLVATLHDAVALHDQPTEFPAQDIALITGILQTCLRIPGIEFCHLQIVTTMKSPTCETARVAANLFSWSTDLAINGDPVYGELSILFLLELSSMPAMAEQLAIDGILGHLGSAKITAALRSGKVNPFVDSAGIQRCYSIWVRGILPLLLNLLDAVGASIATEISLFLNQFPALLNASSFAFDAPETSRIVSKSQPKYMTLSVCSEVHSLSLIIFILNTFRDAQPDIPEVPWDSSAVAENVEFWLGSRAVLRERILPMGKRDIDLARQKPENSISGAVNKLEEVVLAELKGIKDVLSSAEE